MTNDNVLPIEFVDLKKQRARIGDKIDAGIRRVLDHGQFILGPEVKTLEANMQEYLGVKHAIACSNGTDAIALALMTKGVKPGDAIFLPSFTFASTAEVVAWMGASAVFIDVHADTFNMDVASLERGLDTAKKQGLNPKGIISVDLFGLPAEYDAIEAFAKSHGLFVIADAAQAFGATYKGRRVGMYGDITTTSFFPAKPLGCYGDGGAMFTNDTATSELLTSLRFHGKGSDKYDNVRIGMNARLDTMQAAILIEKLAVYQDEIEARNVVAAKYTNELKNTVQTPYIPEYSTSVWAQYTLVLADSTDRAAFQGRLKEQGIPTNVYYPKPLHQQTAYKHHPAAGNGLPVCEKLAGRVVSLPMHPYLTDDQIGYITKAVKQAI